MITGMAHVCFTVSNLENSIQFYCEKLGFKQAFEFRNDQGKRFGVYIKTGKRNFIELFEGTLAARADKQSYSHICLEVNDIQATVKALRERGMDVTEPIMGSDQSWQAWLADPDGNRIELHDYTAESWQTPWVE